MSSINRISSIGGGTGVQAADTAQLNKSVNEASTFAQALERAKANNNDQALMKQCQEFESIFVNMMFKSMKEATNFGDEDSEDSLSEKSFGRGIFEDMRDEELSRKVSQGGGMGIAQMMFKQLKKYTESVQEAPTPTVDEKK